MLGTHSLVFTLLVFPTLGGAGVTVAYTPLPGRQADQEMWPWDLTE